MAASVGLLRRAITVAQHQQPVFHSNQIIAGLPQPMRITSLNATQTFVRPPATQQVQLAAASSGRDLSQSESAETSLANTAAAAAAAQSSVIPRYSNNVTVKELLERQSAGAVTSLTVKPGLERSDTREAAEALICLEAGTKTSPESAAGQASQGARLASGADVRARLSRPTEAAITAAQPAAAAKQFAVVSKTPQGRRAIKVVSADKIQELLARQQAVDKAVQQVVTEVPTTLPTVQIKVNSPYALSNSSMINTRPCTAATMAVKHPIPAVPPIIGNKLAYGSSSSALSSVAAAVSGSRAQAVSTSAAIAALPPLNSAATALVSVKTTPVIHSTLSSRVAPSQSSADVLSRIGTVSLSTIPQTVQVFAEPKASTSTASVNSNTSVTPSKQQKLTTVAQQSSSKNTSPKGFNLSKLKEQGLVLVKTANGQLQFIKSTQLPNVPKVAAAGADITKSQSDIRVMVTSPYAMANPTRVTQSVNYNATQSVVQQQNAINNARRAPAPAGSITAGGVTNSNVLLRPPTAQMARSFATVQQTNQIQLGAVNQTLQPLVTSQVSQPRLVLVNVNGQLMAQAVPQMSLPAANMQLVNSAGGLQLVQQQQTAGLLQPSFQLAQQAVGLTSAGGMANMQLIQQPAVNIVRPVLMQGATQLQTPIAMLQGGMVQQQVVTNNNIVNLNQVFSANNSIP